MVTLDHETELTKRLSVEKDATIVSTHVVPGHENEAATAEEILLSKDEFTADEYKRLMLKVDFILMPMLMIIYGLQFSDKLSLTLGVIFGLREETHMVGNQYADLTLFFYIAYAVAQYPMAALLQRLPLGRALAVCVIVWGGIVMCLGACNNFAQLSVTRTFLGWFESVITPGFAIFTASWYLRREQTLRQSLYYAMNTCFAMIISVGTYYIALNAQKHGGLSAWRVINLFLGGTTVGVGIIFLVFGGTPDEVWWLSAREKRMAKARIVTNGTGRGDKHKWRWDQVRECFRDFQYWMMLLSNLIGSIPNGGITTFQTLIFQSFGFTSLETVLYQLPMYGATFTVVVLSGVLVNFFPRSRFPLALVSQVCTLAALLFAGVSNSGKWAKWGVYLMSPWFSIATFVVNWPFMSMNTAGRTKQSFIGATSLAAGCLGNIIGSQIFLPKDAPRFVTGLVVCAVMLAISTVIYALWWAYLIIENRKRDRAQTGISEEERANHNAINGELDLTDMQNPYFRYMC